MSLGDVQIQVPRSQRKSTAEASGQARGRTTSDAACLNVGLEETHDLTLTSADMAVASQTGISRSVQEAGKVFFAW
jgi:hypothetical protein